VVRRALDEGYDVRCLVRPRLTPADFLRDWGATTVQVRAHACARFFWRSSAGARLWCAACLLFATLAWGAHTAALLLAAAAARWR
jgi:hypothetical protein